MSLESAAADDGGHPFSWIAYSRIDRCPGISAGVRLMLFVGIPFQE
jgi:hypothetical protein